MYTDRSRFYNSYFRKKKRKRGHHNNYDKLVNISTRHSSRKNYFLLLYANDLYRYRDYFFFFLFLVNGVDFHDIVYLGTSTSKKLSDVGEWIPASDLLIRLHGALMLASWIGTASIGMLLARYYRQTWVNSQLCGKDHWFAVSAQLFGQSSSYSMFNIISRLFKIIQSFSIYFHSSNIL